jgi:hypothetical protein
MDFGYVLKRAWQIIWKFKVLWIFGILASCGQASNSAGSNSGYRFSGHNNVTYPFEYTFGQLNPGVIAFLIILAIVVVLVLVVLAIVLGTVGRVGLINGTKKAELGAERLTFGELWHDGMTYFWRVFGLNLLVGITIFVVILLLVFLGVVLTIGTLGLFVLCLLPLLCLVFPVSWAVYVIIEQANIALVVEDLGIIEAIKRGWKVVWSNLGPMIVMSLILLLGVGLIGGIIIGLPLFAISTPAIVGFMTGTTAAIRNGLFVSGLFFILYLPFLLIFSGIIRSYTTSAWTLTYLKLTNKPTQSQLGVPVTPDLAEIPPIPEV